MEGGKRVVRFLLLSGIGWNRTIRSRDDVRKCESRMSLTYVIPDIHGRYDLLGEALAGISARSGGEAGVIVTIGDYVDKGPQSKEVIDRMLSGVTRGWHLVALKGNHDAMMVEALRDPAKMASRFQKGGAPALASHRRAPAAEP